MFAVSFRLVVSMFFALCMGATAFAANCGTGKVLLQDDFATLSPVWNIAKGDDIKNGPKGMEATVAKGKSIYGLNQSGLFNDYEVCLTAKAAVKCTKKDSCEASGFFGVLFWGADNKNYYSCDAAPAYATSAVFRLQNNKFITPVGWAEVPNGGLPKLTQDFVTVSATVKGNHLTCKVNGVVTAEIDGFPPEGGSLFGFEVGSQSSDTENSQFTVKHVELREVQ
jgi:hypothetical protein